MKPKTKQSTILEDRLRRELSRFPPTKFSINPHEFYQRGRRRCQVVVLRSDAPAVTKSWWLPAATRCVGAHGRPDQLRHVTTAGPPPKHRTPHRRNHFLGDFSSILEAAMGTRRASHWCLLEHSDVTKNPDEMKPELPIHFQPFDLVPPKLHLNGVDLGPNPPTSGLTANYTVLVYCNTCSYSPWSTYRNVSIRYECTVPDPFDARGKSMEFASLIQCREKFYAITLQGAVAVMEEIGGRLKITAVGSTRAIPSSRSRFFKEYFVQMMGEIFLFYLIHNKTVEVVDDVEVFRLDLVRLDWIKAESVRGKTMFLKERCDWVDSARYGCRDNCVFFTQGKENKWRVYDLKSRCISSV